MGTWESWRSSTVSVAHLSIIFSHIDKVADSRKEWTVIACHIVEACRRANLADMYAFSEAQPAYPIKTPEKELFRRLEYLTILSPLSKAFALDGMK